LGAKGSDESKPLWNPTLSISNREFKMYSGAYSILESQPKGTIMFKNCRHLLSLLVTPALLAGCCEKCHHCGTNTARHDDCNSTRVRAPDNYDATFVSEAAMANLTEIELGQCAQRQSSSPQVREFAQRMIDDHSAASNQLREAASASGISVPNSMDQHHRRMADDLCAKSGADFDAAYASMMRNDHEKVIATFESAERNVRSPDLKRFASQTVPTLRTHLEQARRLP
jgi:putative membrane protein